MMKADLTKRIYSSIGELPTVAVNARFCAAELRCDRPFVTPVELWQQNARLQLAMRVRGVPAYEITGAAADYEKLIALLGALTQMAGSTLAADLAADLALLAAPYTPDPQNAAAIWHAACRHLSAQDVTPRALLAKTRAALVAVSVCEAGAPPAFGGSILPLLSLDALLHIEAPDFAVSAQTVGKNHGIAVTDLASLEAALCQAVDAFAASGAVAAAVSLSGFSVFEKPDPYHAGQIFAAAMAGKGSVLTATERALWRAQLLRTVGRKLRERGMSLVVRACPKTEHVLGDFSTIAFRKLLTYLAGERALVPTLLSLAAGELPAGLSVLLGRFADAQGKPLLYFGIEGAGAGTAELSRSLRYYLRRGAAPLLLGITDDERGFFTAPAKHRFCRVLAAELAHWAVHDADCTANGGDFAGEANLTAIAAAVVVDNAASFFGCD